LPTSRKLYGHRLPAYAIATAIVLVGAFALAAFYAPMDADQGFSQKIFYVHVPLAIVTLCGFVTGGIYAFRYLRSEDPVLDLKAYTAIHQSLIFCIGALITGSLWAKAAWGQWWVWDEPTLVSFLIVFLLYATYQPLRFSIEDPEKQARYASVFAIVAGAFVPLNFLAVRLADPLIHPRVLNTSGGALPGDMKVAFYTAIIGMALLFITMFKFELTTKHTRAQAKALRRRLGGDDDAPAGRSAAPRLSAS
jgi:heme exporter protein C